MPWFIGLINGTTTCGFTWCSESDPGVPTTCDFWTQWNEATGIFHDPIFGESSIPFTAGTNPHNGNPGLVVECAESNFPTPLFQVGSMIRSTAMPNNGIGQYITVSLENFFQLMGNALNFRCLVEIANFVDPATGRRRAAALRIDSAANVDPRIFVATYGYDAAGIRSDFEFHVIDPVIPAPTLVSAVFELDSYADRQVVIVNGGTELVSFPATAIGAVGGYQSVTMWWDVQFGTCADATSPLISFASGGELCGSVPPITQTVFFYGFNESDNTNNNFDQTFVVPPGVTSLDVLLNGSASWTATSSAGAAKRFGVTIPVTPGETLTLKLGNIPASSNSAGTAGGWPDGGDGGTNTFITPDGLGGGGSTSIWRGATLIAIAGGGGGLPNNLTVPLNAYGGGIGGNTFATGAGSDGVSPGVTVADRQGGFGGTQLAGGAGGPRLSRTPSSLPNPATDTVAGGAGSSLQGGDGASDLTDSTFLAGSGGGGGYFGGGGGSKRKQPVDASGNSAGSGGGGGSSWYDTGLATDAIDDGTLSTSYGYMSITYTIP